ncbi:lipopolysaccharide biosynthesis protein [Mediterraneibacter gnavus]|jgi:O-antigen/teichoic acid export membrane protein|uniref:lipopolysaccharide biosynthesis protein n=1 Tax=Mediterraneibacter gnavus TaxID=33038 RepID=UPI00374E7F6D
MNKEKKDVLSGVFWKFSERMAAQIVSLIVSVILARLLSPSEYGAISLVTVFITIANVFVTSGFGAALIQKKEADNVDFSTVFYFSLVFSTILYGILFVFAEPIANFYNMPILKPVLRVLSLSIIIMGINSVQQAYVSRKMIFKKFFYATSIGTIISAIVGISMAYLGFGVWALVAQTLTNNIIGTIVLQVTIDWRPMCVCSFRRLKSLFKYGWKLLVQSLILQIYSSLRSLIIGKVYTAADLAFYTKGNQFPDLISTNIDTAINSALFPAMSKEQDSIDRVKAMARKTTQVTSYIMNPILIGFMAVAEQFISLLLTDKWLPAVPYLRICCIILLFRAPQTSILQAIKAVGRSDSVLKVDFPIRIFALIVLTISIRFGIIYLALSEILVTILGTFLYAKMANRIINYNGKEVCLDFIVNTMLATIMGTIVWWIGEKLVCHNILVMIIQIILGACIYLILSIVTRNSSFKYVLDTTKEIITKNRK